MLVKIVSYPEFESSIVHFQCSENQDTQIEEKEISQDEEKAFLIELHKVAVMKTYYLYRV